MWKAFDWKRSRISVLEVEAVPQSSEPKADEQISITLMGNTIEAVENFSCLRVKAKYRRNGSKELLKQIGRICLCYLSTNLEQSKVKARYGCVRR
jgi:hypothetical protein